jgi:hypothetical protein
MPFAAGILLGLAYASRKIVGAGLDSSPMTPELGRKNDISQANAQRDREGRTATHG